MKPLVWTAGFLLMVCQLAGQTPQGLIYGRVLTVDEQSYEGLIRWDIEEAFWDDSFSGIKTQNPNLEALTAAQIKALRDKETTETKTWDFMSLWENPYPTHQHVFRCRFGNMARMEITGSQGARIFFKDGTSLELEGGGDVGRRISVYETASELTRLEWDRIDHIDFSAAPADLWQDEPPLQALYGTVLTTQGAFRGYIQWDNEECLSTDMIEGKQGDRMRKFPFGAVAEIKLLSEDLTRVTLFNGRSYELGHTDDLGKRNHGIVVKNLEVGRVIIPWKEFRFVRFEKEVPDSGPAYDRFPQPVDLYGTLLTQEGVAWEGKLTFDLSTQTDVEMLTGSQEGLRYYLPFGNLAYVERRNHQFCAVRLKNGDKLFLEESRQVTDENWGVLVRNKEQVTYVPWQEIERINFTQ
ncbi:MAG: hypothetical protein AAF399_14830 [Bacteroidota bacterium]